MIKINSNIEEIRAILQKLEDAKEQIEQAKRKLQLIYVELSLQTQPEIEKRENT